MATVFVAMSPMFASPALAQPGLMPAAQPAGPPPPSLPPYGVPAGVPLPPPAPLFNPDRGEDRHGIMLNGGFQLGRLTVVDTRLGYMVTPHLAVFGSAGAGFMLDDDTPGITTLMGGARLWINQMFLEARAGRVATRYGCDDFENPCHDTVSDYFAVQGSIGVDVAHKNHIGLEVHLDLMVVDSTTLISAGLGLTFYPL